MSVKTKGYTPQKMMTEEERLAQNAAAITYYITPADRYHMEQDWAKKCGHPTSCVLPPELQAFNSQISTYQKKYDCDPEWAAQLLDIDNRIMNSENSHEIKDMERDKRKILAIIKSEKEDDAFTRLFKE